MSDISEAARAQVKAMVQQTLERSDNEGFTRADFYHAMIALQKTHSLVSLQELLDLTLWRLQGLKEESRG